ncbi:alpha/beta fold hydrolase [Alishewanella jeotgali]|uniref:Putative alpha/beta hydrolase fold protein n=1 Tax=Alishewanella jeotgali KCTC 22429 TaxID=1129374 RepID=H3ZEF6_9ALTE|nr:alpha/beta hydrolase [Alishewanella jeotgali]EHR41087.1 putative alpha/beta hydrolase fold protein [Alishewanella jeotgali KCTC 22429]
MNMTSKLKTFFAVTTVTLALGLTTVSPVAATQTAAAHKVAVPDTQSACACFEVTVVGEGPAILLIPGLASSADVWQSTVAALKDQYQLHIFTLAGFAGVTPLSAQSWGESYLVTQQQAILSYIGEQKLQKPVVIGHSLGGYLALALAASAPEQIGGAVNVDGLPALGALFAENAARNTGSQQAAPGSFDPMLMAKGMANNESWHQRIVNDMFRSDGMTSGRVMGELMQADLRPQLANIRVPVLTLGALQNGAPYTTPAQVQANYETQLANVPAQYHRFAFAVESKHFIMADAPEWLNQHIGQFLQKHLVGKE